ncbi:Cytochrome P450 736A117 [Linum grandiflorum]
MTDNNQNLLFLLHEFFISSPLNLLPLITLILISTKWLFSSSKSTTQNLPPSPPKLPILGNLHQLGTHPHRTLRALARKHGPLMLLRLGSSPTVVASSADSAREIMKTHDLVFANRPYSSIQNRLLYNYKDLSQAPYGEYWRQMRSICVLRLLSPKRVEQFRPIREQEAVLLVKKIESLAQTTSLCGFDLGEMLSAVTNDVVCRVAFGRKYGEGEKGKEFKKLLEDFGAALGTVNVADFIPWLGWVNRFNGVNEMVESVFARFDKFLDEVVEDHKGRIGLVEGKSEDEKDLVDVLLQIQRESAIDGDTVKAIVLDMFAAGSDTSYTALEWTMTEILKNPRVMKKLQQEIRTITGNNKRNVIEDDIKQMPYLKAVLKESFRLHSPIPLLVPRESTRDVTVQGYDIPAKTRVIINAWAIARDTKNWDDPDEFRPERFLDSPIDYKGQDFELIPFGAGRRGCPGVGFATASIEITLASLMNGFDWSLPGGKKSEDLDADEAPGLAVHRKNPLVVVATPWAP